MAGTGTWIGINAGKFTMGSPAGELGYESDEVQHEVTLTRGFVMLSTEVTQAEFNNRMGYNPSYFKLPNYPDCPTCPVETVSWHKAAAYCNALSTAAGRAECYSSDDGGATYHLSTAYGTPYDCPGYRLPTEAEWEYAARAGDVRATYAGELTVTDCTDTTLPEIAWFCGNGSNMTHAVGTKSANAWGLYDMLGNVSEWCHDWYVPYEGNATDPSGPSTGLGRVIRGGSWGDSAVVARAAGRGYNGPGGPNGYLGLRPVRSLP